MLAAWARAGFYNFMQIGLVLLTCQCWRAIIISCKLQIVFMLLTGQCWRAIKNFMQIVLIFYLMVLLGHFCCDHGLCQEFICWSMLAFGPMRAIKSLWDLLRRNNIGFKRSCIYSIFWMYSVFPAVRRAVL